MKTLLDGSELSVMSGFYVLELHAPGAIEQAVRKSLHDIDQIVLVLYARTFHLRPSNL
jgi:hypothetical protein